MPNYQDRNLYPFGIDVSHYDGIIDWQYIKAQAAAAGIPIDWAVAKCGELSYCDQPIKETYDPRFAINVQCAYDAGIPIGAYFFHNPQYYPEVFGSSLDRADPTLDKQISMLREVLKNKKIYFLAVDLERWWIDYNEYNEYLGGNRPLENVRRIPNGIILHTTRIIINNIRSAQQRGWLPFVPVVLYSRNSFIGEYTKTDDGGSMWDDTPKLDLWEAIYPNYKRVNIQWSELKNYLPPAASKPTGMNSKVKLWQFTDGLTLPVSAAAKSGMDCNISMLPRDQLYAWMNYTPAATTTPTDPGTGTTTTTPTDPGTTTTTDPGTTTTTDPGTTTTTPGSQDVLTKLDKLQSDLTALSRHLGL